jgi:hypothetical protein
MQHIPNGSPVHVPITHIRHSKRASTVDDCVACHVRGAYNMLARSVEILTALAKRKRHACRSADECGDTGLPMIGNEPPHAENCECALTRELAYEVFEIEGLLEVMLDKADRLARMVERGGDAQHNVAGEVPAG